MKINMPVTNHEINFKEDELMVTKTNLESVITYANQDFIKISGFSEQELVGASHNLVRHPDMPVEAFEDMWKCFKAGRPWTGLVKNRTKNGDFYWVVANAAPIFEDHQITGYLSACKKPTRQQIAEADAAYRLFKESKARGLRIVDGKVIGNSMAYRLKTRLQNISLSKRLYSMVAIATVISVALVSFSLYQLSNSNDRLKSIYDNAMTPVKTLSKMEALRKDIIIQLSSALNTVSVNGQSLVMNAEAANQSADVIEHNVAARDALWKSYMATYLTPEEKILAGTFTETRAKFIAGVVTPSIAALRANDYAQAKNILDHSTDLRKNSAIAAAALVDFQFDLASDIQKNAIATFERVKIISMASLLLAVMITSWLGWVIMRSITKPLKVAIDVFRKIASNNLSTPINVEGDNEMSEVLLALKTTQTMLNVNLNAQNELAQKIEAESIKYESQLAAIAKSSGVIEFSMDGKVIAANTIFLNIIGYSLDEVIGKHHRVFVDSAYVKSEAYQQFWAKLNNGETITGEFRRLTKEGKEVWLQASYNPILDATGKPYKVVKYATDITEQKLKNIDFAGQIDAIGKSQGVIELDLNGKVLKVNAIYLNMLGYTESELLDHHVSMVLDPTFAKSAAYTELWAKLVQGGTDAGQYKRIAKNGKEVWIQAYYNPVYDLDGKPSKIVNYTTDITAQKMQAADFAGQIEAIGKIQGVVEFDLTGQITSANENFANVTGYSNKEIVGNHHSMFVEAAYRSSQAYKAFWDKLARGEAESGQYKRIGKNGKEIWLQASYNPILDMNGKAFKVVQYATDITAQVLDQQSLVNAVEETKEVIQLAKAGDLSQRISLDGKTGAISSLCDGVNAIMDKMTEVIVQVKEAGETINTASSEIASGNNDLSSRTEQQAASLEETASSMEELSSAVKHNAENAKQANQLAVAASNVAIKGGSAVSQVVSTMAAITTSSRKIEDIISVIDGIAFQTNILALNAAVEAARAGEQGRGFAVVAGEVRNLAQRSATAAKEIKTLISDTVGKVQEGTKLADDAGKTMGDIVSSAQRVADILAEISAASLEQSEGINQVNNAITSMDEVTQQNAALVEQAAAAAESLVEQAMSLMDTVGEFKLQGMGGNSNHSKMLMRPSTKSTSSRPALSSQTPARAVAKSQSTKAKTGTNDESWEEF